MTLCLKWDLNSGLSGLKNPSSAPLGFQPVFLSVPKKSETTQTRICGMLTDQVSVPDVLQEVRPLTGSLALKMSWFVSSECQIQGPPGLGGGGENHTARR